MSARYRVLALMTSAQAGASVIQQGLGGLAPILMLQLGLSKAQLGALLTAMFLGSAAFAVFSGALTDRLGERKMVGVSASMMTLALLAAALAPNYGWLTAAMTFFGAGYGAATPAGGRAIMAWFVRDRGFAMGVRQTGVPIGGLIGAIVLPLAALHFGGYRAALLVGAVLVALPSAIVYIGYREAVTDRAPPGSIGDMFRGLAQLARDPRIIAITLTCIVLANMQLAMTGFLAVTAIQVIGVTPAIAASAFAFAFAAAIVGRLFWGWVNDRFMAGQRIGMLAALCALASLASLLLAVLRPSTAALLFPTAVFFGFCGAGWNGIMAAALAEIGGADRAGSAIGLTLSATFSASAFGPLIFGTIADHTSLGTSWTINAALGVLGVFPALWLRRYERRAAEEPAV